jgi:hypothetical protein
VLRGMDGRYGCIGWFLSVVRFCLHLCVGIRTVEIFDSLLYKPIGASPLWIFNAVNFVVLL